MIRVLHLVQCSIIFILFFDPFWQGGLLKDMKNDQILSIFIHFGHFPQVFGQVNKWLISEVHEMVRALHVVARPILFILFHGRHWQGALLKLTKNNHIFSIFSRFGHFLQVFGQVNEQPVLEVHEMIRVFIQFCAQLFLFCFMSEVGREEFSNF